MGGGKLGARLFVFSLLLLGLSAHAVPSSNPGAQYGAITLSAATATQVPASPLAGRYAIAVFNLDSATVYCGWDASVTASNGFPVPANGNLSVDVSYDANLLRATLYCYSTAGTSSGAIRWMEVR